MLAVTFPKLGHDVQVWLTGSETTGRVVTRERRIEVRRTWDLSRMQREALVARLDDEAVTVSRLVEAVGGEVRGWRPSA